MIQRSGEDEVRNAGRRVQGAHSDARHREPPVAISIHVRAALTWLVIFPLVSVSSAAMGLFAQDWHPVLRALVLTLIVVPTAVYLGVPQMVAIYNQIDCRTRLRGEIAQAAGNKTPAQMSARSGTD